MQLIVCANEVPLTDGRWCLQNTPQPVFGSITGRLGTWKEALSLRIDHHAVKVTAPQSF